MAYLDYYYTKYFGLLRSRLLCWVAVFVITKEVEEEFDILNQQRRSITRAEKTVNVIIF